MSQEEKLEIKLEAVTAAIEAILYAAGYPYYAPLCRRRAGGCGHHPSESRRRERRAVTDTAVHSIRRICARRP